MSTHLRGRRALVPAAASLVMLAAVALVAGLGRRSRPHRLEPLPRGEIVDVVAYQAAGREALARFASRLEAPDREAFERWRELCRRSVVRVHSVLRRQGGHVQADTATGVLVGGGRLVLTAGHLLEKESVELSVTLGSGRRVPARLREREYVLFGGPQHDWGVLEVARDERASGDGAGGEPAGRRADLQAAPLGRPHRGDLVLVAGFPARLGVAADAQLAFDDFMEPNALAPLETLARVESVEPLEMSPVAGAVPLGGMSGAPVFDREGRVVGLFVSVSQSPERPVAWRYGGASLGPVEELLRRVEGALP